MNMKDAELQRIVLQCYYEKRRGVLFTPTPDDFSVPISQDDILAISSQLGEHGLITWKSVGAFGNAEHELGKISAYGIDVVEGEGLSDVKVEFKQNNVSISGSNNVIVGDNNTQNISHHITEIVRALDADDHATPGQREEAKMLLKKFTEHPLVTAIAGGAISLLG